MEEDNALKLEIEKLKDGERYFVPESDYGKAEICRVNDIYVLFEIPLYGGEPRYSSVFPLWRIDEMIKKIDSWS